MSEQTAPEWEYGFRDYRQGVILIGDIDVEKHLSDLRRFYGDRPLVRRRKASEWERVEDV
jgi:hypothetical protein